MPHEFRHGSIPPKHQRKLDYYECYFPFVTFYGFGAVRVAMFTLLTFTALLGSRSCGVVIAKFSGQAVIFRSSPTLFGAGWMPGSTSTRILSGKPPRATWSAAMLFGL
jgi:hypothetical protein